MISFAIPHTLLESEGEDFFRESGQSAIAGMLDASTVPSKTVATSSAKMFLYQMIVDLFRSSFTKLFLVSSTIYTDLFIHAISSGLSESPKAVVDSNAIFS